MFTVICNLQRHETPVLLEGNAPRKVKGAVVVSCVSSLRAADVIRAYEGAMPYANEARWAQFWAAVNAAKEA